MICDAVFFAPMTSLDFSPGKCLLCIRIARLAPLGCLSMLSTIFPNLLLSVFRRVVLTHCRYFAVVKAAFLSALPFTLAGVPSTYSTHEDITRPAQVCRQQEARHDSLAPALLAMFALRDRCS